VTGARRARETASTDTGTHHTVPGSGERVSRPGSLAELRRFVEAQIAARECELAGRGAR
jgi:hypothetical protein